MQQSLLGKGGFSYKQYERIGPRRPYLKMAEDNAGVDIVKETVEMPYYKSTTLIG